MRWHRLSVGAVVLSIAAAVGLMSLLSRPDIPSRDFTGLVGDAARGGYVARMAGCIACHTDSAGGGAFLAGGAPIKTPFGTFRAPNITPHPQDGIGGWTLADFAATLTRGTSPDGTPYYPVFPYPAYTKMTDQDIADLWAAMKTVPPAPGGRAEHDVLFPFHVRTALRAWQTLFLEAGPFEPDPGRGDLWNRGAYIVSGPGHCVACHTPRNIFGARLHDGHLTGSADGPGSEKVPAITASALRAAGWTEANIAWALRTGLTPDGDSLSGSMGEVVRHGTAWLSDGDLRAIAHYLMTTD